MVKFEIEESLNYRGGSHYTFVYADTADEVFEEIRDAWHGSGISRQEGELFLNVYFQGEDGKEICLACGHCSVDGDDDVYSSFNFPYEETNRHKWYSLGLFLEDYETQFFEQVFEFFFDLDSPDRVLGSYLYRLEKTSTGLKGKEATVFGKNVLANILDFGKKYAKSEELYAWLLSADGTNYLEGNPHFEKTALALDSALKNEFITDIDKFIGAFKRELDTAIFLPSSRI